jgi:hypothetical protein
MHIRVTFLLGTLFFLITWSPSLAAPAPADTSSLQTAIADLEYDKRVLVRTDIGQELEGHWRGSDADSIYLVVVAAGRPVAIAQADVLGIWIRGRATHAGAKTLGIAGAAVGGAFGILGGLYAASLPGNEDDAVIPKVALAGVLLAAGGAVIGAATGSVIGAALPRWHPVYSRDPDPAESTTVPAAAPPGQSKDQQPLARFCLVGGYAQGLEKGAQGSPSIRVALLTDVSRHLTLGPELGYAATGYQIVNPGNGYSEVTSIKNTLHAGGALYYIPFRAKISPYLAAGLGLYVRDDQYLGYSLGAGFEFNSTGTGPRVSLDVRYHDGINPQPGTADIEGPWPAFFTAGVGISF